MALDRSLLALKYTTERLHTSLCSECGAQMTVVSGWGLFRADNNEPVCAVCAQSCAPELLTALGALAGAERARQEEPTEPDGAAFTPEDLEPVALWAAAELVVLLQHPYFPHECLEKVHRYLIQAVLARVSGLSRRTGADGQRLLAALAARREARAPLPESDTGKTDAAQGLRNAP